MDSKGTYPGTGAAAASRRGDAAASTFTAGGSPKSGLVRRWYCPGAAVGRLGLLEGGVTSLEEECLLGGVEPSPDAVDAPRATLLIRGLWLFLHTRVMLVQAESRMRTRESEQATDPLLQR